MAPAGGRKAGSFAFLEGRRQLVCRDRRSLVQDRSFRGFLSRTNDVRMAETVCGGGDLRPAAPIELKSAQPVVPGVFSIPSKMRCSLTAVSPMNLVMSECS